MVRNSVWTIGLGSFRGVPIRLHLTFLLFLAIVAFEASAGGQNPLPEVAFVLTLFACVLLHELGHALMALRLGVGTRDITLYPFGGIASLLKEASPRHELLITVAGPAVNILIAFFLFPFIELPRDQQAFQDTTFVTRLFTANVILAIFNLIPAFPMDGGRILRSALSLWGVRSATEIAVRVSQLLSIGLGVLALVSGNIILMIIAAMVFFSAMQELVRAKSRAVALTSVATDVMSRREDLIVLRHGLTVAQGVDVAIRSFQPIYPVLYGSTLLGIVDRQSLISAAASGDENQYLSGFVSKDFEVVGPDTSIIAINEQMESSRSNFLVVAHEGEFLGLIFHDRLVEYLIIHGVREQIRNFPQPQDEGF